MNDFEKAQAVAARYVNYQPRTAFELRQRLEQDKFDCEIITRVVELCVEQGVINDLQFSLMFIADKTRVSKHGKARSVHGLRQKGVSADVVSEAYAVIDAEPQKYIEADSLAQVEYENAVSLIVQKYGNENLADINVMRKAMAFLLRRGYSRDVISKSIKEVLLTKGCD
jgi:regulatory protein